MTFGDIPARLLALCARRNGCTFAQARAALPEPSDSYLSVCFNRLFVRGLVQRSGTMHERTYTAVQTARNALASPKRFRPTTVAARKAQAAAVQEKRAKKVKFAQAEVVTPAEVVPVLCPGYAFSWLRPEERERALAEGEFGRLGIGRYL